MSNSPDLPKIAFAAVDPEGKILHIKLTAVDAWDFIFLTDAIFSLGLRGLVETKKDLYYRGYRVVPVNVTLRGGKRGNTCNSKIFIK